MRSLYLQHRREELERSEVESCTFSPRIKGTREERREERRQQKRQERRKQEEDEYGGYGEYDERVVEDDEDATVYAAADAGAGADADADADTGYDGDISIMAGRPHGSRNGFHNGSNWPTQQQQRQQRQRQQRQRQQRQRFGRDDNGGYDADVSAADVSSSNFLARTTMSEGTMHRVGGQVYMQHHYYYYAQSGRAGMHAIPLLLLLLLCTEWEGRYTCNTTTATVLVLYSYCTPTVLMLYSHCTHAVLPLFSLYAVAEREDPAAAEEGTAGIHVTLLLLLYSPHTVLTLHPLYYRR
jgi:hypothetical protein